MMVKIDTDYLLRVVEALPADLGVVFRGWHGIDGERRRLLDIARELKVTRSQVRRRLEQAEKLILMTIDRPELKTNDLPDLLAVARMRKLAGQPTSSDQDPARSANDAAQLPADAD